MHIRDHIPCGPPALCHSVGRPQTSIANNTVVKTTLADLALHQASLTRMHPLAPMMPVLQVKHPTELSNTIKLSASYFLDLFLFSCQLVLSLAHHRHSLCLLLSNLSSEHRRAPFTFCLILSSPSHPYPTMAFFRPFVSDPFFATPSSALVSLSSSLFFNDDPLFSAYSAVPVRRAFGAQTSCWQEECQQRSSTAAAAEGAAGEL